MFYKNINQCSSDIIVLTQTFLTNSVLDAMLFPPCYKVFSRDRVDECGVRLAVKDQYDAHLNTHVDSLS